MLLIKVGGGKNINWNYIAQDIKNIGEQVIVVHGANVWMRDLSLKFGIKEKIITSPSGHTSRYTDLQTLELLTMVYSGLVNKKIVSCFQKYGINALGLCGADGQLWLGKRKKAILSKEGNKTKLITDSQTGKVESVNKSLIKLLLKSEYVPVITIPAITKEGELINVDNDRAIAIMARDLRIKKIVMLFEAPGLLRNPKNQNTTIKSLNLCGLEENIIKNKDRMKKKLLGIKEAIIAGVEKIYFGDGRISSPITNALNGKGTVIGNE